MQKRPQELWDSLGASRRAVVVGALVVVLALATGFVLSGTDGRAARLVPRAEPAGGDPLAFDAAREDDFRRAAAEGLSHVLFARSPGGAVATAERTARFRALVEQAVATSGFSPDLIEAIIFLESAGRPEVIAGSDPAGAAGLTQIVAETGRSFLGMPIRLEASRALTRRIDAALLRGDVAEARELRAERRRADPRFDPEQALAATMRYLTYARALLGREDLAVASYHMGIGNLEGVLRRFSGAADGDAIRAVVAEHDLSYARVFFDSSPVRHAAAWRRLTELGDDSRHYLWKVLAAQEIMRLHRGEPERLRSLEELHLRKASAEEVLHPPSTTHRLRDPDDVERAWDEGLLHPVPDDPGGLGLSVSPRMGALAPEVEREPELYRGLRSEALAVLVHLAREVRRIAGDPKPVVATSTVRDESYQRLLVAGNLQATRGYSLHTTGYAFDLARDWGSDRQAAAVQFVLERLQAHGLIAWVREPAAIHVTVSTRASVLVPRLLADG